MPRVGSLAEATALAAFSEGPLPKGRQEVAAKARVGNNRLGGKGTKEANEIAGNGSRQPRGVTIVFQQA